MCLIYYCNFSCSFVQMSKMYRIHVCVIVIFFLITISLPPLAAAFKGYAGYAVRLKILKYSFCMRHMFLYIISLYKNWRIFNYTFKCETLAINARRQVNYYIQRATLNLLKQRTQLTQLTLSRIRTVTHTHKTLYITNNYSEP